MGMNGIFVGSSLRIMMNNRLGSGGGCRLGRWFGWIWLVMMVMGLLRNLLDRGCLDILLISQTGVSATIPAAVSIIRAISVLDVG